VLGPASRVEARDHVVVDTRARAIDGALGRGSELNEGGTVTLERAEVRSNRDTGIQLFASTLDATDLVVQGTTETPTGLGRGVVAQDGSRLTLERAAVVDNQAIGVLVRDEGSQGTLTDLRVAETRESVETPGGGLGLFVDAGATVTLTRGWLDGNRGAALSVEDGGDASVEDLLVTDTQVEAELEVLGAGIRCLDGTLDVSRSLLERNVAVGVIAEQSCELSFRDGTIRDTRSLPRPEFADLSYGLVALGAGRVLVERVIVEGSRSVGLAAFTMGELVLSDVVVRDPAFGMPAVAGVGLLVGFGGRAQAQRLLVDGCSLAGLFALEGDVTLSDAIIRDTTSFDDEVYGHGISASEASVLDLRRIVLSRNLETGLVVSDRATAVVRDLLVEDTRGPDCSPGCTDRAPGSSLAAYADGRLDVARFELVGGATCGVQLASDAELDLRNGVVRDHPIAVCLQVANYPQERLRNDVRYTENGVLVESTALPSPVSLEMLAAQLAPLLDTDEG
ncbi:MAG: right-handed parallel beta-helix repeat-containing protein, partial [Myxococcota bacterium]